MLLLPSLPASPALPSSLTPSPSLSYLMNVAPSPLGVWAPDAVTVLQNMAAWNAINGEAIQGTTPCYPFQFGNVFITCAEKTLYALIPSVQPTSAARAPRWRAAKDQQQQSGTSVLIWPWMRQTLLATPLQSVTLLGHGPVAFSFNDTGLVLTVPTPPVMQVELRTYWSAANSDM